MKNGAAGPNPTNRAAVESELYRRLQLSLILRVVMVTFLVGVTIFNHFTRKGATLDDSLIPLYLVSGVTYLFTLVSLVVHRFLKWLRPLAFIQIIWEIAFITALVYITTGANESIFSFLYLLAIIVAAILLYRAGAFFAAVIGSLGYALLLIALERGDLAAAWPLVYEPVGWNRLLYEIFINLAAMFGVAVLVSYLTEKLRATGHQLQETQKRRDALEAINDVVVRSIPSGLITLDLAGHITSFNLAAEAITGVAANRAIGKKLDAVLDPAGAALPLFSRLPDVVTRRETRRETPDGRTQCLEIVLSPMRQADGQKLGALVVVNDDTEIRLMENKLRQADRLAAVGQLAAGIAHEIRNPLASISGAIQVLNQDLKLDPVGQRLMKIVFRETERLNDLITDFLLYARPNPKTIQEVRVDRLISEIIEIGRHRKDLAQPIEWKAEVKGSLTIATDPKLVEQVLWNLINNAVAAMPDGGRLIVRAREEMILAAPAPETEAELPAADRGPELVDAVIVIEVEDNGVGVPAEARDHLFDPFFTTREGGTGLGLSTVYRIVEAMEGTITFKDVEGGGTRFVITVPKQRLKPAATEVATAVPGGIESGKNLGG